MNAPTQGPEGPAQSPLWCLDAEVALIGTILAHDNAVAGVAEFLKPAHFHEPFIRQVYAYVLKLYEAGELPTGYALLKQLIAEFGEKDVIVHFYAEADIPFGLMGLAKVVLDLAERRRMIE